MCSGTVSPYMTPYITYLPCGERMRAQESFLQGKISRQVMKFAMALPSLSKVASSTRRKQRETTNKADLLGVCLIGKRLSSRNVAPVCSGCLVVGLFPRSKEKLYVITSGDVDRSEWENYILFFQRWNSDKHHDDKLKEYALLDITTTEEDIEFIEGVLIIPIDPKKLGKGSVCSFIRRCGSSGIWTYRPCSVQSEEYATGSLAGSICQIVDGGTSGFAVKTFGLEYKGGKYVLELSEKGDVFETRTEVTGKGSNSLHPRGAVILRKTENQRSPAVAVLKFENDEICPVLLSHVQQSGEFFFHSFVS